MLIFVHYPFADLRSLSGIDTGKLPAPSWPSPNPYKEFVRSHGIIRSRSNKGMADWVGENEICDVSRTLKLPTDINIFSSGEYRIDFKVAARHLYFDGLCTGYFTIVLITKPSKISLGSDTLLELIKHLIGTTVEINIPNEPNILATIGTASKPLSKSFEKASTRTDFNSFNGLANVLPCEPYLILQSSPDESIKIPSGSVSNIQRSGVQVNSWWTRNEGYGMLTSSISSEANDSKERVSRHTRIYLSRLHVEEQVFKTVTRVLSDETGRMLTSEDSISYFLNSISRRLIRGMRNSEQIAHPVSWNQARTAMESIAPGRYSTLQERLKFLKVRRQISTKTDNLDRILNGHTLIMGNQHNYYGGQQGVFGENNKVNQLKQNQEAEGEESKDKLNVESPSEQKPFWKEWWFISIFSGVISAFLSAILISPEYLSKIGWRLPVAIGAGVTTIMLLRNPKRRYMTAFSSIFCAFSAWNILPGLKAIFQQADSDKEISFEFIFESTNWVVSLGMIFIMCLLLYLDYRERRD